MQVVLMTKISNMNKGLLRISVFIVLVAMVCACGGDDDDPSGNATNGKSTAVFNSSVTYGSLTDQDGNIYKTVTIGTQTWMAENLRTTKYNDGTAIPKESESFSTPAYCNYNNSDEAIAIATYGRMYNWFAVNTGKLAPKGWHVPTDAEWTILTDHLGGAGGAGDNLREMGTLHWTAPNTGATNEAGFTGLPGGYSGNDKFFDRGNTGLWWSTSESSTVPEVAVHLTMNPFASSTSLYTISKQTGISVRCIKD